MIPAYIYIYIYIYYYTNIYIQYIYINSRRRLPRPSLLLIAGKLRSCKEHEPQRCWKSVTYEGKHFNYVIYKRQRLTIIVSMGSGDPEVSNYPMLWGTAKPTRQLSHKYRELALHVGRLARADLSP